MMVRAAWVVLLDDPNMTPRLAEGDGEDWLLPGHDDPYTGSDVMVVCDLDDAPAVDIAALLRRRVERQARYEAEQEIRAKRRLLHRLNRAAECGKGIAAERGGRFEDDPKFWSLIGVAFMLDRKELNHDQALRVFRALGDSDDAP